MHNRLEPQWFLFHGSVQFPPSTARTDRSAQRLVVVIRANCFTTLRCFGNTDRRAGPDAACSSLQLWVARRGQPQPLSASRRRSLAAG